MLNTPDEHFLAQEWPTMLKLMYTCSIMMQFDCFDIVNLLNKFYFIFSTRILAVGE
jgi:hypothetical protein